MADDTHLLDADWDKLSPEKKTELQALVQNLDMAKLYQQNTMLGGKNGGRTYAGLMQTGGLSPEHATALARFRQYNMNQASDPNWQGPPQAPITGPIAPPIVVRPRDQLDQPVPAGMVVRTGMPKEQAERSDIDNRYAELTKRSQSPIAAPPLEPGQAQRGNFKMATLPEEPADAPDDNKLASGFLQLLQKLGAAPTTSKQ